MRSALPFVVTLAILPTSVLAAGHSETKAAPHARVSFVDGQLFVRGPFDGDELPVDLNSVLREGDVVRSGDSTLAEIELPSETFLRFSSNTIARIDRLSPSLELSVVEGSAYISTGHGSSDVLVSSTFGRVGPSSDTMVRLKASRVEKSLATRVARGTAEVTCTEEVASLGAAESLSCEDGKATHGQWRTDREDRFDRWNQEREQHVRNVSPLPTEIAGNYDGLYDLEGHGDWVFESGGWYWQPTVVSTSWRPYYDGYWSWNQPWGWTWVPYQPWGFVTHHYGRWVRLPAHGWVWSPAPVFSGAWVVWASFDGYLGWAPSDFWGRPIVLYSGYSYYDPYVWCFGPAHYFYGGGGNYLRDGWYASYLSGGGYQPTPEHRGGRVFFTAPRDPTLSLRGEPIRDPIASLAPAPDSSRRNQRNQLQPGSGSMNGSMGGGTALRRLVEVADLNHRAGVLHAKASSAWTSGDEPVRYNGETIRGAEHASNIRGASGVRSFDPAYNPGINPKSGRVEEKPLFERPQTRLTRRSTEELAQPESIHTAPVETIESSRLPRVETIEPSRLSPVETIEPSRLPPVESIGQQRPQRYEAYPSPGGATIQPRFGQPPAQSFSMPNTQQVQPRFGQPPAQSFSTPNPQQVQPRFGQPPAQSFSVPSTQQVQPRFGQPAAMGFTMPQFRAAPAQTPHYGAPAFQHAPVSSPAPTSGFRPAPVSSFKPAPMMSIPHAAPVVKSAPASKGSSGKK